MDKELRYLCSKDKRVYSLWMENAPVQPGLSRALVPSDQVAAGLHSSRRGPQSLPPALSHFLCPSWLDSGSSLGTRGEEPK